MDTAQTPGAGGHIESGDPQTRDWYDYAGRKFTAPASARTTFGIYDRLNHYLFAADNPNMLSPQTWCGHRAGEIPGRGPVDCPACLERDSDG